MLYRTRMNLLLLVFLTLLLPGAATAAGPDSPSYSRLVLDDLEVLESKLTDLASAIPGEHFTWRPGDDARSVSEVFTHVASASYFYVQHLGTPIPRGAFRGHRNLEEVTAKEDVVSVLAAALKHARDHVVEHGAEPQATSLQMLTHLHEHLGQAIAYARSLGIPPPWSAEESG